MNNLFYLYGLIYISYFLQSLWNIISFDREFVKNSIDEFQQISDNSQSQQEYKYRVKELEFFIWKAESVWMGKIIKKECKYIFKSNSYGVIDSSEFNMNTEIKNKVLDVLKEYLVELKEKLESM